MKEKRIYLKNGYQIVFQHFSKEVSHLFIYDHNIYPDKDERSEESWRRNGLIIPINSDEDLEQIRKLLKK
jgi:hypothetical protein